MRRGWFGLFFVGLAIVISAPRAEAQIFNPVSGTIEQPPGNVIGQVINGVAQTVTGAIPGVPGGRPLSQTPPGITQIVGTDGNFYVIAANGAITAQGDGND